jgi:hypothetical protein
MYFRNAIFRGLNSYDGKINRFSIAFIIPHCFYGIGRFQRLRSVESEFFICNVKIVFLNPSLFILNHLFRHFQNFLFDRTSYSLIKERKGGIFFSFYLRQMFYLDIAYLELVF